jgi:hypothetical protein
MTMAPDRQPADRDQIRAAVAARYGGLARAAQAGENVTDCDAGAFATGCFGASGYPDAGGLPGGAVRASLGCFAEYRDGLTRAGFTGISITATHQAGDGVHAAVIRAARP